MSKRNKILVSISIIVLFIVSLLVSYAFFSARIYGNESTSTIVGTAAYLELTFSDGNKQINASNIVPGWSDSKTFKVKNTGEETAYYVIRISDITNPYIYGSISYDIVGDNNVTIEKYTLPLMEMPVSSVIEIPINTTHNYTITTYYNNLEESQKQDLGKSFSYTVSIEAVYKKEINYIEDLVDLSNEVNAGNTYAKTWFLQQRDLDFNDSTSYKNASNMSYGDINGNGIVEPIKTELTTGSGFVPIGNSTNMFYGSYDGQNHRLDNLYENRNTTTIHQGFFGAINNSTIANIIILGSVSNANTASVSGLASAAYGNSVIYNVQSYVNVSQTSGSNIASGILGVVYGYAYIRNCTNYGNISGSNNTAGIVGYSGNNLIIEKTHNEGKITNLTGSYIGGIIGRAPKLEGTTQIYGSYNSGDIIVTRDSSLAVGGIMGTVAGSLNIEKSYNTGTVKNTVATLSSNLNMCIGGILGSISSTNNNEIYISDSYNTGNVENANRVGGIIANNQGIANGKVIINRTYNLGQITSIKVTSGTDTTSCNGGLFGYNRGSNDVYILNSYNNNIVSNSSEGGSLYIGGLVGMSNRGNLYIINSYNGNNVVNSNTSASGIIGRCAMPFVLNNTFNIGNIDGKNSYELLVMDNSSSYTINNTYYLYGKTASNISNVGTSKTSAYMSSTAFVNELNQNKRAIDLTTEYDGVLAGYELSDWKYDSTKGYPVLDN